MSATPEFLETLRQGALAQGLRQSSVLVAVSGGADSISLLRGLLSLPDLELQLHVAHLNHELRGTASDEDAVWIAELCQQLNVPCHIERENVQQISDTQKVGLEEAARAVRYRFLEGLAVRLKLTHIAVAHTANDQVETVLHHIVRGSGLSGLSGVPATRRLRSGVMLVRPLLALRRPHIEQYLAELGQDYRTDYSNQNPDFTRNRIRGQLLPQLMRDYNPRVSDALLRLADQAREVLEDISVQATAVLEAALINQTTDSVLILCRHLPARPVIVRECLVEVWRRQNWPRQNMGYDLWCAVADLVRQPEGALTLPGKIDARRREGLLVLTGPSEPE